MFSYRQRKQATYALGAGLTVILFITLVVVSVRESPVVAVPTPTSNYQAIVVEEVTVVHHRQGHDVVARLRNPNPTAGVADYPVDFVVLDNQNQATSRLRKNTYLLPGATQYVIALQVSRAALNPNIRVDLPSAVTFTEIPAAVTLPSLTVFIRERTNRLIGQQPIQEQKGIVRNVGTLSWQKVEVVGLALDAQGAVVGVGETFVGELTTGEQREFTLQWPAPGTDPSQVIVIPSTNIYREDNIVKILGDPALLR